MGGVSLAEENLSPELAAAVSDIAPSCRNCSSYALVFEGGRKVVTIEVNGGNDC